MKNYDVRICGCGRVHFIDVEKIDKAIENEKEVLVICNHCGHSYVIGADKEQDENGEDCYMMYSFGKQDTEINDVSKIDSIVFTVGESIRMMTGGEATTHMGHEFIDWETKKPDNVSDKEWETLRKTVDVQHTINWIRDEEKLKHMSQYLMGINWAGTKYAR